MITLGNAIFFLKGDNKDLKDKLQESEVEVRRSSNVLSGMAGQLSGFFKGALLGAGIAVAGAVVGIGTAAFDMAQQVQQSGNVLQTQLGLSTIEADKLKQTALGIFGDNFAADIGDATQSLITVRQQMKGLADNELKGATENALRLRDAFGIELPESTNAANVLMEKFGLTSQQAFDFITTGQQRGLNASGDFLDTITEYGVQFSDAGFSAAQFFSTLETGAQGGALGTDKAADAIKEFRIRIMEMSDDVWGPDGAMRHELGMTNDEITAMSDGLKNGTVSAGDAFETLMPKLAGIENEVYRNTVGVKLFGTQWEDLGPSAVLALDTTKTKLEDLQGSTASLDAQYNNLGAVFEGFKRQALVAIVPIGDELLKLANAVMPSVLAGFNWLKDSLPGIIETGKKVVMDGVAVITGLFTQAGDKATWLGQTFQTVKDIIVLAWQVIQATIVPTILFIAQFITDHQTEILHVFENVWAAVQITIGGALNLIKGILTAVMQAINGDWSGAWATIQQTCADFVLAIVKLIQLNWDTIKTIFGGLVTAAMAKMVELKDGIVTKFNEIVSAAKSKVDEFVGIGANIVAGIRQGFADQWDSFLGWIDRQIDKIPKVVREALGIESPSKVMYEIGAPIIDGLSNGILARMPSLLGTIGKVTESVIKQFQSLQDKANAIMADLFGGRASFARNMSSNVDFVASLREGLDDFRAVNDSIFEGMERRTSISAEVDALNAENASLSPEDRIANQEKINKLQAEYYENEAKIAANQVRLRNDTEQRHKLNDLANETQRQLAYAVTQSKQYADPREAAAFLKLRSDQIKEMATLQRELLLAKDANERSDIQQQLDLIAAAQSSDMAQFEYDRRATGGGSNDLRDLIAALNKMITDGKQGGTTFSLSIFGQTIDGSDLIQGYETLRALAGAST